MSTADTIRQGLIARGIEPHIAEAFLWNFQHESGLNPTVVERVPNVHGTRGRGLYQLTGSRRNAYEGRYGDDYSIDNQLDWLMYELQGPESAAWSRIQGAQDTGQAGCGYCASLFAPCGAASRPANCRIHWVARRRKLAMPLIHQLVGQWQKTPWRCLAWNLRAKMH
jgi:hypothetical protein